MEKEGSANPGSGGRRRYVAARHVTACYSTTRAVGLFARPVSVPSRLPVRRLLLIPLQRTAGAGGQSSQLDNVEWHEPPLQVSCLAHVGLGLARRLRNTRPASKQLPSGVGASNPRVSKQVGVDGDNDNQTCHRPCVWE